MKKHDQMWYFKHKLSQLLQNSKQQIKSTSIISHINSRMGEGSNIITNQCTWGWRWSSNSEHTEISNVFYVSLKVFSRLGKGGFNIYSETSTYSTYTSVVTSQESNTFCMFVSLVFRWLCGCGLSRTKGYSITCKCKHRKVMLWYRSLVGI